MVCWSAESSAGLRDALKVASSALRLAVLSDQKRVASLAWRQAGQKGVRSVAQRERNWAEMKAGLTDHSTVVTKAFHWAVRTVQNWAEMSAGPKVGMWAFQKAD